MSYFGNKCSIFLFQKKIKESFFFTNFKFILTFLELIYLILQPFFSFFFSNI